jgi:hypothetical protein
MLSRAEAPQISKLLQFDTNLLITRDKKFCLNKATSEVNINRQ